MIRDYGIADLMSRALAATDQLGTALADMISVLDALRDSLSMPVQSGFTAPSNAPAILEDVAAARASPRPARQDRLRPRASGLHPRPHRNPDVRPDHRCHQTALPARPPCRPHVGAPLVAHQRGCRQHRRSPPAVMAERSPCTPHPQNPVRNSPGKDGVVRYQFWLNC